MSEVPKTGSLNIPTEHTTGTPIMSARGLVKRYGNVTAIDGADFDLYPGEILAVIGDNGAGKSSLIKTLSGAVIPDQGEIRLDGEPVHFKSPLEARRAGIETVYRTWRWHRPWTSRRTCSWVGRSAGPGRWGACCAWWTSAA
jgi:ABC-type branched-subunit amino acid transport system ATPase component